MSQQIESGVTKTLSDGVADPASKASRRTRRASAQDSDAKSLAKRVNFRLSESDFARFEERYKAAGMSASEFFRDCVLNNRTKVIARPTRSVDRKLLLYAINKIGNNLNQLAHAANAANLSGRASEPTYRAILDHLQWVERYLTGVLGRVD